MAPAKPVVDVAAEQILERLAVALGERRDDHLVGRPGALQEGIGIEGRVGADDVDEALGDAGVARGQPLDALLDVGAHLRLRHGPRLERLVALAPRQRHDLVLAGELAVALGGLLLLRLVALVASLLVTRATAEHAAQLEKDHDRQNEKQ